MMRSWLIPLAAAVVLAACAPAELPVLVFDLRAALCVDQQADGDCNAEITVDDPVQPLRSDYLVRPPYVLAGAIALAGGDHIELHTPGATLASTRDVGGATVLTYDIDADTGRWAEAGEKVHLTIDGSTHVGGEGPTHTAWVVLDYRYSPQAFAVEDIQGVEVDVLARVQVELPGNEAHNDDRPVMYGGRTYFDAASIAALAAGMGPDNTLHLDVTPLLVERWLDQGGQSVDHVPQLAISVLR